MAYKAVRVSYKEVSVIFVSVGIQKGPLPLHLSRHPGSVIHTPVRIVIHSLALHLPLKPLSFEALYHATGAV